MAQTATSQDPQIEELLAVERRFDAALLSADTAALQTFLAGAFFLNDFMGGVVSKAALLEYLGSGALKFHRIEPHGLTVHRHADTGLVTGWTDMKAELQGALSEVKSRFLHVYVKENETWRMLAAQGTVIPELDS